MAKTTKVKKVSDQVKNNTDTEAVAKVVTVKPRPESSPLLTGGEKEAPQSDDQVAYALGKFQGTMDAFLKQMGSMMMLQVKQQKEIKKPVAKAVAVGELGVKDETLTKIEKGIEESNLSLSEIVVLLKAGQKQGVSKSSPELKTPKKSVSIRTAVKEGLEAAGLGKVSKEFDLPERLDKILKTKETASATVIQKEMQRIVTELRESAEEGKEERKLTKDELVLLNKYLEEQQSDKEDEKLVGKTGKKGAWSEEAKANLKEENALRRERTNEVKGKAVGAGMEALGLGGLDEFLDVPGLFKGKGISKNAPKLWKSAKVNARGAKSTVGKVAAGAKKLLPNTMRAAKSVSGSVGRTAASVAGRVLPMASGALTAGGGMLASAGSALSAAALPAAGIAAAGALGYGAGTLINKISVGGGKNVGDKVAEGFQGVHDIFAKDTTKEDDAAIQAIKDEGLRRRQAKAKVAETTTKAMVTVEPTSTMSTTEKVDMQEGKKMAPGIEVAMKRQTEIEKASKVTQSPPQVMMMPQASNQQEKAPMIRSNVDDYGIALMSLGVFA